MNNEQIFQKPWQLTLLRIHAVIEKVVAPIERLFSKLNPNNAIFQAELDRKSLTVVK
jgi:hypothetical protein